MRNAYEALVEMAIPYHNERLEHLRTVFRLSEYERFDFDQLTGLLTFSDRGVAKLNAPCQMIGSHSTVSETWLWSWGNSSIVPNLVTGALRVREYGLEHEIVELVKPKFEASDDDAWRLAAVSAFILKSFGVYRCPVRIGSSFLALESASWAT